MPFPVPPLAFGFANLLMLGWLAAAAAPLLIHLWNKRRYREVSWAAIEYLLAAMRKNSRRMRIEQLILLLVRTAVIVLLVLAVAQPYLDQLGLPFVAGQRTLKVLVLDGSYSMAYKPTDKSRFDRAKQLAEQIVDESSQGDAFMLVLMADPPSVVVGTPAVDPSDFLQELETLTLQHGGADLAATLTEVERVITAASGLGHARTDVYFLTDLGRNTWAPESRSLSTTDARQRLGRLAEQATLVVLDLGQSTTENLALTSLSTSEPYVTTAREVSFTAQVRNFGTQSRNHHLVELFVDGRRIKEAFVDVAAGEQAPVGFTHRFDSPGDHIVEARLGSDLLDVDNYRWLSVPVKDQLRVLCVNGKPASAPMTGATDYLALALNPTGAAGGSVIAPEVIAESALLERDLSQYDCIFLCNVAQFTASEARLLAGVLDRGGGLVFFLGDQVLAARYNRELGGEQGPRILPAQLGPLVREAQYQYRFDPLEYRHPLLDVFKGRQQAGLLTTPVYTYFRLQLPEDHNARVALAFESGDPAIIEETIGRGRSILVATECSLSSVDPTTRNPWTTMPAWPSFVPLVQELVALAVQGQLSDRNAEVGQTIGQSLSGIANRAAIQIETPGGATEQVRLAVDASGSRWSYADTRLSGVYQVDSLQNDQREAFAININTAESDLSRIAPEELPAGFTMQRQAITDDTESASVQHRSGLHKLLLYGVLGLLFTETFLAWWFGRMSR